MSTINSTVRFCPKCQTETERITRGDCKVCAAANSAAYRSANPSKVKAYNAAYRVANPEKVKALTAAWAKTHQEHRNANDRARRAVNPEKARANAAARYAANPEKANARSSAWKKANPEAMRILRQNYKAKKRANGGILSKGLSAKLFKLQHGKCACCGLPLGGNFHLDHILPIYLGGVNEDSNIQLLRSTCNQQKSAKHPIDFMQSRGFLL